MKKKIRTSEEETQEANSEISDNERDTLSQENNDLNNTQDTPADGSQMPATDEKNEKTTVTDKVEKELQETVAKLAEMQDKYIRLSAEFDNYRKRTLREKIDISKYAAEEIMVRIIPLMDDFERALLHMENAADCIAMKSGIDLIYNKFNEFLKQNGVKEIEALNNGFDVDIHEAVAKVPVNEDDKKGKVVDVVLKGYYLQDKVLRFSKVVVGE